MRPRVALALAYVKSGRAGIALSRQDFRPDLAVLRRILRIGVPISLQDGFIQVAFLVIGHDLTVTMCAEGGQLQLWLAQGG